MSRNDRHCRAQNYCRRKHGDWRYDPGTLSHWVRYYLPANAAALVDVMRRWRSTNSVP